ncbi:MAG TPA: SgcJ/EcaC family oxidoreductase [Thermoanaerobaculia bacterium]|nr:SgcJ/EcaC family oxidoreductase [Thermoanaerobaculia bacterium]
MRIFMLTLLMSLSLLVAGCPPAEGPAGELAAISDPAAAREAIDRLRDEWIAAAERDDAAAVAALYTEDAVVTSPDDPPAEGREAIEALWTRNFPMASGLEVRSTKTAVSGDVAYDFGEFSQRLTPPEGEPMDVTGEFLVALERQPDGSWKLSRHVSFSRPPESAEGE